MTNKEKSIQAVQFPSFGEEVRASGQERTLDMLLDIPLQLSVELGRTSMRVEDILDLKPGSIVVLNKLAGEPVDVIVNEHRIAAGEVIVLDDNFGVRMTAIVSQDERLKQLK